LYYRDKQGYRLSHNLRLSIEDTIRLTKFLNKDEKISSETIMIKSDNILYYFSWDTNYNYVLITTIPAGISVYHQRDRFELYGLTAKELCRLLLVNLSIENLYENTTDENAQTNFAEMIKNKMNDNLRSVFG